MSVATWLTALLALLCGCLGYCLHRNRAELRRTRSELDAQGRALTEARQALDDFIYRASHDLQSPVRAIEGYTQLLAKRYADRLDGDALDFLEYASQGAVQISAMIQGLLDYSRIHTRPGVTAAVALSEALDDALLELGAKAELEHIELEQGTLPVVSGDPGELRALFAQLLENAVAHCAAGRSCRIAVHAERNGPLWRLVIDDNGAGVPTDRLERIFEPFERLSGTGAGLGLAICRRIVEKRGGRIWAERLEGGGLRMVCLLPGADGANLAPQQRGRAA